MIGYKQHIHTILFDWAFSRLLGSWVDGGGHPAIAMLTDSRNVVTQNSFHVGSSSRNPESQFSSSLLSLRENVVYAEDINQKVYSKQAG